MTLTQDQITKLNLMIFYCIEHGGDSGGGYLSCRIECENAIRNFLESLEVDNIEIISMEEYPHIMAISKSGWQY